MGFIHMGKLGIAAKTARQGDNADTYGTWVMHFGTTYMALSNSDMAFSIKGHYATRPYANYPIKE